MPIFWGHGTTDPVVRFELGKASVDILKSEVGIAEAVKGTTGTPQGLSFNAYPGVLHSTNGQELDDLSMWLRRALPSQQ